MNPHITHQSEQVKPASATWYEYHFADRQGHGLPHGTYKARNGQWNVVLHRSKGRYIEEASNLGGSMFEEYQFRLTVRAATAAEASAAEREHREVRERLAEAKNRQRIFQIINTTFRQFGEWPKRPAVSARAPRFRGSFLMNINGQLHYASSGTSYVIDDESNVLWSLTDNGLDGDDWSRNNLPGTIAFRLPMFRAEAVTAFLRHSEETLSNAVPTHLIEEIEKWALNPCSHAANLIT
ncbi:hypothetical protein V4C53_23490 [Paraburkholderia azotifigens]|uniref:hypothetical protein n=1 Tax=Paraburkholderia azotifigens TaxID=2057004 RepID=UPI0031718D46